MPEEIKEKPQVSGKIVERDEKGRFKKGHPKLGGSEKGKSYSLIVILKRKLAKIIKEKGMEAGEELVDIWLELARKDFNALKEVVRYTDGMPKESLELGIDEKIGKVEIEIVKSKEEKKEKDDNNNSQKPNGLQERKKEE